MKKSIPLLAAALLVAGCQSAPDAPLRATAALQPTKGNKAFGEATFEQVGDKVRVKTPAGEITFKIKKIR